MPTEPSASPPVGRGPVPGAEQRPSTIDLAGLEPPHPLTRLADLVGGDWRSVAGGAMAVVAVALLGWVLLRPDPPRSEDVIPLAPSSTPALPAPVVTDPVATSEPLGPVLVHAAGAVVAPGLYELPAGSRVADLLAAAGGAAPDADLDRLNLAEPIVDGSRVYVPVVGEQVVPEPVEATGPTGVEPGAAGAGPGTPAEPVAVDVNTATLDQLDELPGVGPATAQAIIDHRTANGPFVSVEGLLEVRGIGEAKLADLRDLVTVG